MKSPSLALAVLLAFAALASPAEAQRRGQGVEGGPGQKPTQLGDMNEKQFNIGAIWQLREINGKPLPAGAEATLTIDTAQRGSGFAGCNTFSATMWPVRGQKIALGPPALTRKACPAPLMAFERAYLAALFNQPAWDIVQGYLVIKSRGGTLKYSRSL